MILDLAPSEGPALLGLVGLLIFAPGLVLTEEPALLIFLIPSFSLIASGFGHLHYEENFKQHVRIAKENLARR